MADKTIKLLDFIRINSDNSIADLDNKTKLRILDSASKSERGGLLITFDLSTAGRKTNNRIYTPSGQREGVDSWTTPYKKPILLNHDSKGPVFGRFQEVTYKSLEQEAINHLGDVRKYLELKRQFDTNSPKGVYRVMNKYNLFNDQKWPGMGKLTAKARITDRDAIERFLDERYLTFSAGSRTNAYFCMVCGSAWHEGDICNDRPGVKNEDGLVGVFMTGGFYGEEGSVATMPANDGSQVTHMEFCDFDASFVDEVNNQPWVFFDMKDSLPVTESLIEIETPKEQDLSIEDLSELEIDTVVKQIFDGQLDFADALSGASHYEISWLIRMHDALHDAYDYRLSYASETKEMDMRIPMAVYKLHGAIHDISMQKNFRDSLVNGPLDGFNSKGATSSEYMIKLPQSKDVLTEVQELKDMIMKLNTALQDTAEQKDDSLAAPESVEGDIDAKDSAESGSIQEEKEEKEVKNEILNELSVDQKEALLALAGEDLKDQMKALLGLEDTEQEIELDADWFTLDLALTAMVKDMHGEDAELSTEKRKELPGSAFCGPDRSFPVNDCAHYTAALRLLGRYKGPGDKEKIRACIERKGEKLGCGSQEDSQEEASKDCKCKECKCKDYETLEQDYTQALSQVDNLKTQLAEVLEAHVNMHKVEISDTENTNRLDSLLTWFGNIDAVNKKENQNPIQHIQVVENPSIASSETIKREGKLTDFDQKFVVRYKKLKDEQGQMTADSFYRQNRRYLSPDFDLNLYLDNN